MTTTMAVEDIQFTLRELLDRLTPGEEIILTRNQQPVAKLVSAVPIPQSKQRPGPGLCKGMITYIAADFDAPLVAVAPERGNRTPVRSGEGEA